MTASRGTFTDTDTDTEAMNAKGALDTTSGPPGICTSISDGSSRISWRG